MKKSSKTYLSVVNSGIDVPGAAFGRTGVTFTKPQKLESLNQMMAAIKEMEGGTSWWYGDIGLQIQKQAIEDKKGEGYLTERADILGITRTHLYDCMTVAKFFPISERTDKEGVTFSHHEQAMRGAGGANGDLKKAKLWISQAIENNWAVSDLRKHVSLTLAKPRDTQSATAEANAFAQIDELDAWLAKRPALPVLTAATARTQLVRWQALVSFVDQLKAIAGQS